MNETLEVLFKQAVSAGDKAQEYRHTLMEYAGRTEYLDVPPQRELPRKYAVKDCLSCLSSLCDTIAELCRHLSDLRDPRQFAPHRPPHAFDLHVPSFRSRVHDLYTASNDCRRLLDSFTGLHQQLASLSPSALPPEAEATIKCIHTLCTSIESFHMHVENFCLLYDKSHLADLL